MLKKNDAVSWEVCDFTLDGGLENHRIKKVAGPMYSALTYFLALSRAEEPVRSEFWKFTKCSLRVKSYPLLGTFKKRHLKFHSNVLGGGRLFESCIAQQIKMIRNLCPVSGAQLPIAKGV